MTSISCDICFEPFSELKRTPKFLECGHTFCVVCLDNLLQSQKLCPTCKSSLNKSLVEYPINYIALRKVNTTRETKCSSIVRTLRDLENLLLLRKELMYKSIWARTTLKNVINNGLTRIQQMLEMDEDILNPGDVQNLISELEVDVERVDETLFCCDKPDLKATYSLNEYRNELSFLYDLANRLHKGEDIYAYKMVHNSKPKYGKIMLGSDRINIEALTLSLVHKKASIVAFEDLKSCVTKENFCTYIKIGTQILDCVVTDSSFLASRFIKLCSGETGSTFKGVSGTTPPKVATNIAPAQTGNNFQRTIVRQNVTQNVIQNEYLLIEKYMIDDEEAQGFDDYDMDIFSDEKETTGSIGETLVQMFSDGKCKIEKCVTAGSTCKNIVAKVDKKCYVMLYGMNPAVISDCGFSLFLKL